MPFVANTPESFLDRSDSKNPASTCKGITSAGRPCRRPIPTIPTAQNGRQPGTKRPQLPNPGDERFYCWQHKDQAHISTHSSPATGISQAPILEEPLQPRTSLDTLADKLGLLDVRGHKRRKPKDEKASRSSRPSGRHAQSRPKPTGKLDFCFCFSIPIEEKHDHHARPRPQPVAVQKHSVSAPPPMVKPNYGGRTGRVSSTNVHAPLATSPGKASVTPRKPTASQTAQLKGLVPDTLDSATASALMTELSRPYVDSEEPGYIYMFWLTPASSRTSPPVDAARSLLAPPPASLERSRRPSDVVSAFADTTDAKPGRKTMLLKIGRAANVQRRMNQWQRQCGKDIEVLRYYPHHSQSPHPSPSPSPSPGRGKLHSAQSPGPVMTPHVKRVERLVHIELAGMGLAAERGECKACGREHREWFEVEAQRRAVRRVDGVIKRWVQWDMDNV